MSRDSIPIEQLLAYAAGELGSAERAAVEARLTSDQEAFATVTLYQSIRSAMAADDSVAPPEHVVARAKAIFSKPQESPLAGWLQRAQQLVARLVFDSRTQPALAGMRAASQSCSLIYETDHESIDVQAEPRCDADGRILAWQVVGQVEHDDRSEQCPVAFVSVRSASQTKETTLDERGMFSIDLLPGEYEICVGLPRHTVVVPRFDLT